MYKVICNYGTNKNTLTLKGAREWLPYCGKDVKIINRFTGKIVVRRIQE
jgi:hypothetical protein